MDIAGKAAETSTDSCAEARNTRLLLAVTLILSLKVPGLYGPSKGMRLALCPCGKEKSAAAGDAFRRNETARNWYNRAR